MRGRLNTCNYGDNDLIRLAQGGDRIAEDILVERYYGIARGMVKYYYICGGDGDDVIQEGLIGLMDAVRSFNKSLSVPFRSFARLCVSRRIISAVRAAKRNKHIPLNSYISFNIEGKSESLISDEPSSNPEYIIIGHESESFVEALTDCVLSNYEKKVLYGYINKSTYSEIALSLGSDIKSVSNAMSRIRKKLHKFLDEAVK